MRREQANSYILYLLVVIAGFMLYSLLPERSGIRLFVNSDALYMPSIYQDLFVHRSGIEGWHLNGAPNFFPEMLLYFPLMALLKGTALTSMVYGVVQMFLLMFMMDRLLLLADKNLSSTTRYLILLSFLLFPLSAVLGDGHLIPSQLLLPGYHAGFFFNSLLAAVLALSYLKKGSTGTLAFLGIVTFLAVISDKLFIMGFVAPASLFSLLHLFQKGMNLRHLVLVASLVLTTLLGLITFNRINNTAAIEMISAGSKMFQFEEIPEAMLNLVHHMKSVIIDYPIQRLLVLATLLFIIAAPVYLIKYLRSYLSRKLKPGMENSYGLILYLFLFVFLIFFTPVINGYYIGRGLIRYNYAALILGAAGFVYLAAVLLSPYTLPHWFKKQFTTVCTTGLIILLLVLGVRNHSVSGLRKYVNHYPESVRILDELKSKFGLIYGLGGYWQAKYSTMFSRNNLRLYSVSNKSFKPTYHVTNENWFHNGGKGTHANPTFNFLETSAYSDTEKLKQLFGERMDTIYNQDDLLVIKVPDFKMERKSRDIYLLDP